MQKESGMQRHKHWKGFVAYCMSKVHNILTESAQGGHAKTYNCIASTYYWPKMS